MDDSPIQTALCVVGHPIGGNPTQFVALRALAALGLEWQFVSFDVATEDIQRALAGIDSLGFCGAMIASPYQSQVAGFLASIRGEPAEDTETVQWYDCLSRDSNNTLIASNVYAESLDRAIRSLLGTEHSLDQCLLIGDHAKLPGLIAPFTQLLPASRLVVSASNLASWPIEATLPETNTDSTIHEPKPAYDVEATPSLIIWAVETRPTKKAVAKPSAQMPTPAFVAELVLQLHPGSLLVDLSGTAAAWLAVRNEETKPLISVISKVDLDVSQLAIAIQRWTGQEPNLDLIREAIEEYLEI